MKALGMIEVYGYLAAVEALDCALKAANVRMLSVSLVTGGLVSVIVTGDVGSVKAAVDSASAAAERVGRVVSVHVIPRPDDAVIRMLGFDKEKTGISAVSAALKGMKAGSAAVISISDEKVEPKQTYAAGAAGKPEIYHMSVLEAMSITELRKYALILGVPGMSNNKIRRADRTVLMDAIDKHQGQEE